MPASLFSIARFTLLEAARTRLAPVTVLVVMSAFAAAYFAASLALTDAAGYRSGIYAGAVRVALVAVIALAVAASVVREIEQRWLELTLSRPVTRTAWYLGRLLGFAMAAFVMALAAGAPLLSLVPPAQVGAWSASLAAELVLVAAASLTCAFTLRNVTATAAAVAAFYVLSRTMSAIALMSTGPGVDPAAWSTAVIAKCVTVLAWLLPPLDTFTRAAWLGAPGAAPALGEVLLQTAVYVALLAGIGLFDAHRRDGA